MIRVKRRFVMKLNPVRDWEVKGSAYVNQDINAATESVLTVRKHFTTLTFTRHFIFVSIF